MARRLRPRTALSLIELLIAIAVMGILAALVLPSANPTIRDQLVSTAQIVAADLAYGRSLAVANDSSYRFTFDLTLNRYTLTHCGTNSALNVLPKTAFSNFDDLPTRHVVDLDDLPHVGPAVRLAAVGAYSNTSVQRLAQLDFGPLGETTPSMDIVIWLAAGSGEGCRYVPLYVNPTTGLTTVGSYSGYGPPASILGPAS